MGGEGWRAGGMSSLSFTHTLSPLCFFLFIYHGPKEATGKLTDCNFHVQLLKLEWFSLNKDLLQAKNADLDGVVFDSDIEDAARLREEVMRKPSRALETVPEVSASQETDADVDADVDADEMMVDLLEQEQQAELEALMSSISSQQSSMKPPDSAHWSDDEEYDALFMDYLSQEQEDGQHQGPASSGEMDLS